MLPQDSVMFTICCPWASDGKGASSSSKSLKPEFSKLSRMSMMYNKSGKFSSSKSRVEKLTALLLNAWRQPSMGEG